MVLKYCMVAVPCLGLLFSTFGEILCVTLSFDLCSLRISRLMTHHSIFSIYSVDIDAFDSYIRLFVSLSICK